MVFFICNHCGKKMRVNPRLKFGIQRYCGFVECQKARKRRWKKDAYRCNPDYRAKCHLHNKKWRKKYPAHVYQRTYRATHPAYTERNRFQQRKRNSSGCVVYRSHEGKKIVNRNALFSHATSTGLYICFPTTWKKIVNGNALFVKVCIQGGTHSQTHCRHP